MLVAASIVSWQFGVSTATGIVLAALVLTLAKQLASTPEVNSGHRAGGKGFAGVSVSLVTSRILSKAQLGDHRTHSRLKRTIFGVCQ